MWYSGRPGPCWGAGGQGGQPAYSTPARLSFILSIKTMIPLPFPILVDFTSIRSAPLLRIVQEVKARYSLNSGGRQGERFRLKGQPFKHEYYTPVVTGSIYMYKPTSSAPLLPGKTAVTLKIRVQFLVHVGMATTDISIIVGHPRLYGMISLSGSCFEGSNHCIYVTGWGCDWGVSICSTLW